MALIDNLNAYWKLEETSGTRYDETANNNDLTDYNTVGYAAGIIGNGADFEQTASESLYIADNASLSITGSMTLSCWVNLESSAARHDLMSKFKDTSGGYSWILRLIQTSGTNYDIYWDNSSNGTSLANSKTTTTTSFSNGTWYHISMVYTSGVGANIIFYVNGSKVGNTVSTANTSIYNSAAKFILSGNEASSGNPQTFMDGVLDEVGVWSRALTSTEITSLYNSGDGLTYPFTTATNTTNFFNFI